MTATRSFAMSRGAGGWWQVELPGSFELGDYAYSLDGGEPLPDPRSRFQPTGVHSYSRPVDYRAFRWSDKNWRSPSLASAVIYEIHIGTFTHDGTFDAAIEKLDHLVKLGVTHIELMPVAEFSGDRGWGYDGVDLFAPHHSYGGPNGLMRLIDACHRRGLAAIIDVVYNHLGPDGAYLAQFGPYMTDRYKTPWGAAVNLDGAGSDEVRRFFCDNALTWLRDYHFDGLRVDAVHAIFDASSVHFLEQLSSEVKALEALLGRSLVVIAESDLHKPVLVTPVQAGGWGLDAQWNDDFHHAIHALLTGEHAGYYEDFGTLGHLARSLSNVFVLDGRFSRFRQRRHGRPVFNLDGDRFVAFVQNHDQIGNRALGERLGHLVDRDRLKMAAAALLTAPFVPLLFQGEEWNASSPFQYFTSYADPILAGAVRRGRREEFKPFHGAEAVPDPQAMETFARSKLRWEECELESHCEILRWYRALIELRREVPDLSDPRRARVKVLYDADRGWLLMRRGGCSVVFNFAPEPCTVPLADAGANLSPILVSKPGVAPGLDCVEMPGHSVAILVPPS